jgi:AcrR family transcriptional regulator
MARKVRQDWFIEGFRILAERGASALTIDELTTRLGVTKGSFYHHFGSSDSFRDALLTFWEEEATLNIIRAAESTPAPKLTTLLALTLQPEPAEGIEVAIRAWALRDAAVRTYQQRVDEQRLAYLSRLCREAGYEDAQAARMSQMIYAIYVGAQQIVPPLGAEALRHLYEEFVRMYPLTQKE